MGFWTVRYTPFPIVFSGTPLALLVLVASGSILFLVRSLGHWVSSQLRDPRSVSWGIVGLFVLRIPFGVIGTLLEVGFSPIWGSPLSVLWSFIISHASLFLGVTRRWICGHLGF